MISNIHTPLDCFLCRRSAVAKLKNGKDVCLNCSYVPGVVEFSSQPKNVWEQYAIVEAGQKAGTYLDKIGKSDLAELSEEQWIEFLHTFVDSFGSSVRKQIISGKAPF